MTFLRKQVAIAAFVAGVFTSSFAAEHLRSSISNLENESKIQQVNIQKVRRNLNRKTIEIEKLKSDDNGIVSKLLLQKKMREAQFVSKELESLVKNQSVLNQTIHQQRNKLLTQIDGEISQLTQNGVTHRPAQLQSLQKLINEKEHILLLQHQTLIQVPDFNLSSASQSGKDELVEKLLVVEDLQKNMKQKITFMKDELSEEQSREFLRNEVAHFLDEENFFGEQSFISSGLNRKENANNLAAQALQKDTSKAIPTDQPVTPEATPPSTSNPSPTDGSAPTTDATTEVAVAPSITSQSTSFQQPPDLYLFQNLLDQVQETIRDTDSKTAAKSDDSKKVLADSKKTVRKTKKNVLQHNLALSEQILNDLNTLHDKLSKQIQELQ